MKEQGLYTKHIDIHKIISESQSKFLKKLPNFAIGILAKIIKQEEINLILHNYSKNVGIDFLPKMLEEFNVTLQIEGLENLPEYGKCFFASNHPFGIMDGLILTHTVSQKYGDLKAIGNDAFMFIPQLRPLIAAVNVFGKSSKEYLTELEKVYDSDIPITHFPAGLVSRKIDGKVQDFAWQKSFITKAISSKRDVVPFYFYGRNSRLFYSIFTIRKFFGIKMAIELMLLPHEMFNKKNKTIRVRIGKPISYTVFDKSKSHKEWAEELRKHVYNMGQSVTAKDFISQRN